MPAHTPGMGDCCVASNTRRYRAGERGDGMTRLDDKWAMRVVNKYWRDKPMTRTEKMAYLMRELLGVRHDWARLYGEQGRDAVTRELDVALAGIEVEIQYAEAKEAQRERTV